MRETLAGWGRYPSFETDIQTGSRPADIAEAAITAGVIARGNGRAYGDSAIGKPTTLDMRGCDRFLAFDSASGQLIAEAGVLLADVIRTFLPQGWFPRVTPGTKFVTLGGMIAADVHGKNHHAEGGMGSCVDWIDLMDEGGVVRRCSPTSNSELFWWTIGGMGLTGVILRAAIRLRAVETGWIRQRLQPAPDLESAVAALRTADDSTYSVAWIDCLARGKRLGRSLVMSGEHAGAEELTASAAGDPFAMTPRRTLKVPVTPPGWLLNGLSVRAFNALYYRRGVLARGDSLVDWDQYFYPLDAILGWNRIYGRRGFVQHQCVLPPDTAIEGLRAMLETIGDAGIGSFLAVLKKLGPAEGHFAFPMAGYTLALDFPMRRTTPPLLEKLDRLVIEHGGRLYLAKDASMSAETLHAMDPRAEDFARWRAQQGLSERFQSMQSERLSL